MRLNLISRTRSVILCVCVCSQRADRPLLGSGVPKWRLQCEDLRQPTRTGFQRHHRDQVSLPSSATCARAITALAMRSQVPEELWKCAPCKFTLAPVYGLDPMLPRIGSSLLSKSSCFFPPRHVSPARCWLLVSFRARMDAHVKS